MSEDTSAELPRYKCHKEVHAVKIAKIESDWSRVVALDGDTTKITDEYWITPAEEGFSPFRVSREFIRKHDPKVSGYYVVYADGYQSYSPAKAFEEGYSKVE